MPSYKANHIVKKIGSHNDHHISNLSYDLTSESEMTPCIKIDKPLVVYRFSGNFMK